MAAAWAAEARNLLSPARMRALVSLSVLAVGACGPAASHVDAAPDAGADPRTCLAPAADRSGTRLWSDALGSAQVEVDDAGPCLRTYTLTSTASRRDDLPTNPRIVIEQAGAPTLRSGNDLFDALYALALDEVRECSVDAISDGAFSGGAPVPCPEGGCFETGRLWKYVWTRDISYAVDLGLAGLDPRRARNSLEFKLSTPRTGGPEQIVQDTGTGGSYPVSTDRVTWAYGAAALLPHLAGADRDAFARRAYDALRATLEHDRVVVYDADDGLYAGEQSFLDWREQSYPAWTAGDVAPIASSKALGTNITHLRALELAAELAVELGETAGAARYTGWSDALRARIRERFWLEDAGMFSTFVTTYLDRAPARQFDLLGSSLAVLSGVASERQADRILASYPHLGPGAAPVLFPQQQLTPIYHNRAEWPFVTAYWLRAAAAADHPAVADRAIRSLIRGAALNLSNMENLEIATGAPWVDDGPASGPVVNSHRQLWSVAGYVSMVHHTVFGLRFASDELRIEPYLPRALRDALFSGTDSLVLNDVPWQGKQLTIVLHLPPSGGSTGRYTVGEVRLNGRPLAGAAISASELDAQNRVDVHLAPPSPTGVEPSLELRDAADWRAIYAPRVPAITGVRSAGSSVALDLSAGGEDPSTIRYAVYRDGAQLADEVPGTATSFTDATADATASPCYVVETCFTSTGNCSQRSRPMCWWGDGAARVHAIPASQFVATGGVASNDHGRFHYGSWGDPGSSLVVPSVQPARSGPHLLQVVYGNGAGPINTGITCALKRITVEDTATSEVVASGVLVMPHLGDWSRWADSTFVPANLDAGRTYRITIRGDASTVNMSAFDHFSAYAGAGGAAGPFERVNISELKLLAR